MSSEDNTRRCRLCEIRKDISEDVGEYAQRLYDMLPEKERSGEDEIQERLSVCESCEKYVGGTCMACGCYPLIRAMAKKNRCPDARW